MEKQLTKNLERYLRGMNMMLDYQLGLAFKFYENRAGFELNRLEVIEDPRHTEFRTQYDNLIKRAKETGLT